MFFLGGLGFYFSLVLFDLFCLIFVFFHLHESFVSFNFFSFSYFNENFVSCEKKNYWKSLGEGMCGRVFWCSIVGASVPDPVKVSSIILLYKSLLLYIEKIASVSRFGRGFCLPLSDSCVLLCTFILLKTSLSLCFFKPIICSEIISFKLNVLVSVFMSII